MQVRWQKLVSIADFVPETEQTPAECVPPHGGSPLDPAKELEQVGASKGSCGRLCRAMISGNLKSDAEATDEPALLLVHSCSMHWFDLPGFAFGSNRLPKPDPLGRGDWATH